jgi:hypothetical protein
MKVTLEVSEICDFLHWAEKQPGITVFRITGRPFEEARLTDKKGNVMIVAINPLNGEVRGGMRLQRLITKFKEATYGKGD